MNWSQIGNILAIIVFLVWIGIVWYGLIYAFSRGWGPIIRSKRQKKLRVYAKIKDKLEAQDYDMWGQELVVCRKVLVFECEDGVDRDYDVHDDLYDWVEIGDDGHLTFQGDIFHGFEARRPRQDPDKLFQNWTRSR